MDDSNGHDRAHMYAIGRVQGVGFRWTVKKLAETAGVVGTVRNLRDGSVEVWAEADQGVLVTFVGAVFRGSSVGHVSDLRVEWSAARGDWTSFDIIV